ncbi:MAG: hypothetical protein D6722_11945 [Bacteroidetes bacterium]|nr:MAG: hypothetical protein D6722_11945 [Bacteroidota bacterium]
MKTNLIRFFTLALLAPLFLLSCNQNKIKQLESENQRLRDEKVVQDSLLTDFMETFNAFETNLAQIRERESLVAMNADNPEFRTEGKERVIEDMTLINELLEQNRLIIDSLEQKVAASDGRLGEFRRMVTRLKQQLAEKDAEVVTLKDQLVAMNFEVESLNRRVDTLGRMNNNLARLSDTQSQELAMQEEQLRIQEELMARQQAEMQTAFFVTGSMRDLKEKNVLTREGGFIGIGGSKKLLDDFSQEPFTQIDITEIRTIPIDTKKAEIVTQHPSDSYVLNETDKRIQSLEITDPERFWSSSKYLVVVLN